MATKQVTLPEIGAVTLYKRRGNRSLRLSVAADGEVRISMPYWLPYKAGEEFALRKSAWIAAHRHTKPASLQHGQSVGKAHRLYFAPSVQATKISTRLRQNAIEINHPAGYASYDAPVQEAARGAAVRALRKEAEQLLPIRLRQLAEASGFSYNSVGFKQLKSRWGSCSSNRDIVLNLYLMQLPWHLIDYVLLHELTHTKVMQHGTPFWQELERHAPHARRLRREIRDYHPILSGPSTQDML